MIERNNNLDSINQYNNRQNISDNEENQRIHIPIRSQDELSSFGGVDRSKFTILDKIINDYGYGWEVNKIIFSAFLCFILNGYLTTSYCSFMLGFKKKFDLTNNQISL